MSIFVSVEDAEGEQLAEVYELYSIQRKFIAAKGVCLRFVDDWNDASFNALQTPLLQEELAALSAEGLETAALRELERLQKTVARFAGKSGTYIRFYADGGKGDGAQPD